MQTKRILVLLALFFTLFFSHKKPVYADVNLWSKTVTLHLLNESEADVDASLLQVKESGANGIALSPGWLTSSTTSTDVFRKPRTSSDAIVLYTINKAHSLGLSVLLKPHLDISTGVWRANINPSDKVVFFANYQNMILGYAAIAEQTNTESLAVGSELYKLTNNPDNEIYWRNLIAEVRKVYNGKLTYNANASSSYVEEANLPFWDALDYIGISMYRRVSDTNSTNIDAIKAKWTKIETDFVLPLYMKIGKPIMFTEIGYRSADGAGMNPGIYDTKPPVDFQEQADLYQAFFEFWQDKPYIIGVNFWDWKPVSRVALTPVTDYTPQGKPAYDILKSFFSENIDTTSIPLPIPTPIPVLDTLPDVLPVPVVPVVDEVVDMAEVIVQENGLTDVVDVPAPEFNYEISIDSPKSLIVSGEKKLKIFIKDLDPSDYTAFYKVDNKEQTKMSNSGKFKQSKINFDKWTWAKNGPYTIVITAVGKSDKIIAEKTFLVVVKH